MEQLKHIGSLFEPDERFRGYGIRNHETGETRPVEIEDLQAEAPGLLLPEHVPVSIRDAFTTVLNLWLYGWFHYPFCTMAHVHGLLLVEPAARNRAVREGLTDAENMSLRSLMEAARARGVSSLKDAPSFL